MDFMFRVGTGSLGTGAVKFLKLFSVGTGAVDFMMSHNDIVPISDITYWDNIVLPILVAYWRIDIEPILTAVT